MPAYRSSSSSSDSSSGYPRRSTPAPSIHITFFEYLRQFENDDLYEELMVAVFGRQDLIMKTNEIKHLAKLVQRLQDEANEQQDYMLEIFNTMKNEGLDRILGKKYVRDNGIIRKRRGLQFDLSSKNKKRANSIHRPSTPYPKEGSSTAFIKKPIHRLQYSPTASEYSPTASSYGEPLPSSQPEPSTSRLSPTFVPEEYFPNLDFPLTKTQYNTALRLELYNQLQERLIDEDEFARRMMGIPEQVITEIRQGQNGGQRDWMVYNSGIGTRYNPIILDD